MNTHRKKRMIGSAALLVIAAAAAGLAVSGCNPQVQREVDTLKDLRPFVPRSPAARQQKIQDRTDVPALTAMLSDPDQGVVMRAAAALGETGDPEATPPLIHMLGNPDASLRFVVSKALVQLGPAAVPALMDATADANPTVAASVIGILADIRDPRAVLRLIELAKHNPDNTVGLSAIDALGGMGDPRAVPVLMDALAQRDTQAHYAAIASLTRIGGEAVPALLVGLDGPDPDMTLAVVEILGKIGDGRAVPPLMAKLRTDPPDAVRMALVRTLGTLKDPAAIPALALGLMDRLSVVRALAADALVNMGPAAIQPLLKALGSHDPEIQDLAAQALARIGDPAVEGLMARLSDGDPRVQWLVMDILGSIKDQRAVAPLVKQLKSRDPDLSMKAVDTLGAIGGDAAAGPLVERLADRNSPARLAAADALVAVGSPAVPRLVEALALEDMAARSLARDALIRIGEPSIQPVSEELKSPDGQIREQAAQTLAAMGQEGIDALGAALIGDHPDARFTAAQALLESKNPAATPQLVNALMYWPSRQVAAKTLDALGWAPTTPEERTYYRVAKGNMDKLLEDWGTTRYILLRMLQATSTVTNRYAANALIAIGEPETLPLLAGFLKIRGTQEIAGTFLNAENPELTTAARQWEKENGIVDPDMFPFDRVLWASMKHSP